MKNLFTAFCWLIIAFTWAIVDSGGWWWPLIVFGIIATILFLFIIILHATVKKVITRGSDGVPYLVRYTILKCKCFSIKIHNILISDDDCLHDHPWPFLTWLLSSGYHEYSERHGFKYYRRWSLLWRPATYKHKLVIDAPVWTFIITFKPVRVWGFWNSQGFTPWCKWVSSGNRKCD